MTTRQESTDKRPPAGPEREVYTTPALTRNGTVEELTQSPISTDNTTTGNGIPL
jgi:hypothetical protein